MIIKLFRYLYKPENMIVDTFYNQESGNVTYVSESGMTGEIASGIHSIDTAAKTVLTAFIDDFELL